MLDFVSVKTTPNKRGIDVYPEFITKRSKDLMVKGRSFYAVWDEENERWSTSEYDAQRLIDKEIRKYASDHFEGVDGIYLTLLENFSTRKWTEWQTYCKSLPDNYHDLDTKILFSNSKIDKHDYATKVLDYPMESGDISAYNELFSVLYSDEEREKLEWSIGAIISGDSKRLQKFLVLYGPPKSGKSTFLNMLSDMFQGYTCVFDAKDLGNSNSSFALEPFKNNPLIAIQQDGDLSRIEDNTRLNSLVAHESMVVNEKFKSKYEMRFNSFLFMGTNKPVKITDAKSGILRRLIDVTPTGNIVPEKRYLQLIKQIKFEYGAIAAHCLKVYETLGSNYYSRYTPISMMYDTNSFYNFMSDEYFFFTKENPDGVNIETAWKRYKQYVVDANVSYPYSKMIFKQEIRNYFDEFDGKILIGFKKNKFQILKGYVEEETGWIDLKEQESLFDKEFADCAAQYANDDGIPKNKWDKVKTKLSDLNTSLLHYLLIPDEIGLISVDFDLRDKDGNKSLKLNLEAANMWPKTYCEVSQSGSGIHLEYYYKGDIRELSPVYDIGIEIKTCAGKGSLRRKLTLCNDIPIATLNSGLPKKEKKQMLIKSKINDEKHLRSLIIKNLKKEIHPNTKPSIDMIYMLIEEAYNSGMVYDIRDMRNDILTFANNSNNNAVYCIGLVNKMHFSSGTEPTNNVEFDDDTPIVIYDIEVFVNLFVICYVKVDLDDILNMDLNSLIDKYKDKVIRLINPKPEIIELLTSYRLVGFNNRKYDNHIVFAKIMGYNNNQLYDLSQRIIKDGVLKNGFNEAYNISYTDIYDFMSSSNKMSLKKWEIKLGIHHLELGIPWDQPVPEDLWDTVAKYCCNDVIATLATWNHKDVRADWSARCILAELSGKTVNDTTNQHTMAIIVGNDPKPQDQFVYTDLSTIFPGYEFNPDGIDQTKYNEGTKIVAGKSLYRGEDPGEGGYVYANPGIHYDVALMDIASMHPTSVHELNMFGDEYTEAFWTLVQIRLHIKHKEYDYVRKLFDGKLAPYLDDPAKAKSLSNALKTAINSVYGLTSAKFPNKLRDPRNIDNIVAKRGALFMINLKHEVQNKGYTVVHIKTDSIKIANADQAIIDFVTHYGQQYGYNFEYEAHYAKMCLVNESTYLALEDGIDNGEKIKPFWTATGAQFQVPYVFKSLCSHEDITFEDLCETKSVTTSLYLDMNEGLKEGEHDYKFVGRVGSFTPILDGHGGGVLLRDAGNGKLSAAVGTKKQYKVPKGECPVYKWLESEQVEALHKEDVIDYGYFDYLVGEARQEIDKYDDVEEFLDPNNTINPNFMNIPEGVDDEIPFD